MLKTRGICNTVINMNKILISFVFAFVLLSSTVFAIGMLPVDKNLGWLEVNKTYIVGFNLTNRYPYDYPINVTFELVRGSDSLASDVTLPSDIVVYPNETRREFNITINPANIESGNQTIVFRPKIRINADPAVESTGNVDAGFMIGITATGTINFTVPPVTIIIERVVETVTVGGGGTSYIIQKEIVSKYKKLEIEAPWFVETTEDVSVYIKIKNMGDTEIENLTIELISKFSMRMEYDNIIGSLLPDEQKSIGVLLGNFTNEYNFIEIIVSDSEHQWTGSFVVSVPEVKILAEADCIDLKKTDFIILADSPQQINTTLENKCNFTLHNLDIAIDGLPFKKHVDEITDSMFLSFDIQLPEGEYNYTFVAFYDEGLSKKFIKIYSIFIEDYINLIILILTVFIVLLVALTLFFVYKRRKKEKEILMHIENRR